MKRFPVRIAAVAFACLGLAACGSNVPSPSGWTSAGPTAWAKDGQTYTQATKPWSGNLTDLANTVSVGELTSRKGLTYGGSVPFPGCEGFGGLMTFAQKSPKPGRIIQLAFMVSDSTATTVTYERSAAQPADPAAETAMHQAICRA
jgi:hypothetical protein